MRSSAVLVALALLFSGRANAISRVGNNDDVPGFNGELQDSAEGFVAAVPNEFPNVNSVNDGSAQLFSNAEYTVSSEGSGGPLTMYAYPLAAAYPDLVNLNETEVQDYMRTKFHAKVTVIANKGCGVFLLGENSLGYTGIAKWGTNGYSLSVQKSSSDSGRDGIIRILQSTKIVKACNP